MEIIYLMMFLIILGLNFYHAAKKTLKLYVKGGMDHMIKQTEVTMLEVEVDSVSMDDSFFNGDLILRLAARLNIPLSDIRVVEAVNENDFDRRKRSTTGEKVKLAIEIGQSPNKKSDFVPDPFSGSTSSDSTSEKGMMHSDRIYRSCVADDNTICCCRRPDTTSGTEETCLRHFLEIMKRSLHNFVFVSKLTAPP